MIFCQFITDERDPQLKRCTRKGCGRTSRAPNPPERIVAPCRSKARQATGPGTFLERSLSRWNYKHCENCDCKAKTKLMDRVGWQWCSRNIDTIVGWLQSNAKKCGYSWTVVHDIAAPVFVRRAIAKAQRAQRAADKRA